MARRQEIVCVCRQPPRPKPRWPPRRRPQSHGRRGDRRGSQRRLLPAQARGWRWRGRRLTPEVVPGAPRSSRSPSLRRSTARARSCGKFLERGSDRFVIAEGHDPVADDLAGFMTLAGDEQDIARPQLGDGAPDCFAPVADLGGARRRRQNRGADRSGIFAAGIIVGDDYTVGLGGRTRAHQRPLAGIAIAAGANHDDQTSGSVRTQCLERLCQRIRLVRVIDEDLRAAAFADAFETTLGALKTFKPREYRAGVVAGSDGEAGCEERVLGLERAGERETDAIEFALVFKLKFLAKTVTHRFEKPNSASLAADRRDYKTARLRRALHSVGMFVIDIDDRAY